VKDHKKWLLYAGLVLVGVYFSPQIKGGLGKIPVIGPKLGSV
jgi:hypothetical protein